MSKVFNRINHAMSELTIAKTEMSVLYNNENREKLKEAFQKFHDARKEVGLFARDNLNHLL